MSLITDLPAIFDQFSEARQKGFLTVMDLKEQNVPLVGTYCTFMRRSPWRRAPLSSRCAQPPMKPSRKRKKISRATSARLSKAATASAKPINVPTSISLTWWLGKPPATAKENV